MLSDKDKSEEASWAAEQLCSEARLLPPGSILFPQEQVALGSSEHPFSA